MIKYKIDIDTHCHSIVSPDATSTLNECIKEARKKDLKGLCLTNHGPLYKNGIGKDYFYSLSKMPDKVDDFEVFFGAEANIVDYFGNVDLDNVCLAGLKWVIASIHTNTLKRASESQITSAYTGALKNPYIHALGHIDQTFYMCDFEKVIKTAKEYNKVIEINNNSLAGIRPGSEKLCIDIALLCKKYNTYVCVSSDAHISEDIGKFNLATDILSSVDFPDELIINGNINKFKTYIKEMR